MPTRSYGQLMRLFMFDCHPALAAYVRYSKSMWSNQHQRLPPPLRNSMLAENIASFRAFDDKKLDEMSLDFETASPFPHLVIDNLFNETLLTDVLPEFGKKTESWTSFNSQMQIKRATVSDAQLLPAAQTFFDLVHSGPFLRFVTRVSGISGLIPDPSLFGGGMHEVPSGGHFQPHVDFLVHPTTGLLNRVVVITYLNKGWTASDGGGFELWQTTPPVCMKSIVPVFGRTIIMQQSSLAVHGLPDPVGPGLQRRALIAYYYTCKASTASSTARADTAYISNPGQTMRQRAEIILRLVSPPLALNVLRATSVRLRAERKIQDENSAARES